MIALGIATNRIPRLLLSQKSSKSSRRCVGVAPSSHPRNFLSSGDTSVIEKLFVKAMSLCRPEAREAKGEREESNMSMVVITSKAMDCLFDMWVILVRCAHHFAE